MAKMVPEGVTRFVGGEGEAEVYEALRRLPDSCTVVYSLNWLHSGRARQRGAPAQRAEGEGDFVVFDPARGILVIEVKGGSIKFENGRCIQTNRRTGEITRPDPAWQASSTAHRLYEELSDDPATSGCVVRHAVWFPSGSTDRKTDLPLAYHHHTTFDISDLQAPEAAVQRAFDYWQRTGSHHALTEKGGVRVLARLLPSLEIVPSMQAKVADRERALVQLTREQARIMEFLDDQQRAVVAGVAGTGKTLVGLEKARRLADSGGLVAFLCFNAALRNYLAATHGNSHIEFHTFHSLARNHVGVGEPDEIAAKFVDYLSNDGKLKFDHVIVDEGQDFEADWIDWLAARTEGAFYVFYDRHQMVQRETLPDWFTRAECKLTLRRNVRNTTAIAKFATRCANVEGSAPDSVEGPRPRLHLARDRAHAREVSAKLIAALTAEARVAAEAVALLSLNAVDSALFAGLGHHGGRKLSAEPTAGAVTANSVRRFKGLEATAVILVDVDLRRFADPEWRRLLYVGGSRARQFLHVVLDPVNEAGIAEAVAHLDPSPQRARNLGSLARLLHANVAENADDPFAE